MTHDHHPRTSDMIAALPDGFATETLSIYDLIAAMRGRVFALGILLFALPNIFPMPPGIPAACGAVLMLLGGQLAFGNDRLWVPRFVGRRTLTRESLRNLANRSVPWIRKFERFSRPRLDSLTTPLVNRITGIVIFILGLVLLMPFPFLGNVPPGFAACILGLGLVERDGVIVLIGFISSVLAVGITVATTWLLAAGAMWFF